MADRLGAPSSQDNDGERETSHCQEKVVEMNGSLVGQVLSGSSDSKADDSASNGVVDNEGGSGGLEVAERALRQTDDTETGAPIPVSGEAGDATLSLKVPPESLPSSVTFDTSCEADAATEAPGQSSQPSSRSSSPHPPFSRVKLSPEAAEFVPMAGKPAMQPVSGSSDVKKVGSPVAGRQPKKQQDRNQSSPLQSIQGFPGGHKHPNIHMQGPGFSPPGISVGQIPQLPTNLPLEVQQQLAQQFILQREAMMLFQQQQQQGVHPQMPPPHIPPQMQQHFAMIQAQQQLDRQQFHGLNQQIQGPNQEFPGPGPNPRFQSPNRQFPPVHQPPFSGPSQRFQQSASSPQQEMQPQFEQMQHFGEQHQVQGLLPQQQASVPPEIVEELREKIVRQVEFYLSDQNLPTDNFLMKIVRKDSEGWVPIRTIAGFNKIKSLSKSQAVIAQAVRSSQQLVVSPDGRKVRRSQPLPDVNLFDIQMRTVVAENLPANPTIEGMEALFGAVGKVNMVRICHPEGANSATQSAREAQAKSKDGLSLLVSTRQHAVVEMGSVELADRACLELTDRQNWRSGLQVRPLVRRQGLRKGAPGRAQQGEGEGEGSGTEGEASKERKAQALPDGHAYGRGRGRGQQGQAATGPGTQNRDPSPAKSALPKGPRMPDGTKGFTLGRGRAVLHTGGPATPIGAPATDSESRFAAEEQSNGVNNVALKEKEDNKVVREAFGGTETSESAHVSERPEDDCESSIAEIASQSTVEGAKGTKPSGLESASQASGNNASKIAYNNMSKPVLTDELES